MAYHRKTDNAKAQIVEHSPVTDSVYVQLLTSRRRLSPGTNLLKW